MSIGFGVLPEGGTNASLLITTANVFIGAGFVARCLASYTAHLCEKRERWQAEVVLEKALARSGDEATKLRRRVALARRMIKQLEAEADDADDEHPPSPPPSRPLLPTRLSLPSVPGRG